MTNVNQEKNDATSTSLPLRGFAMVLIAVAVVLGLWALYALTQGGGDEESTPAAATSSAPAGGAEGPTTSAAAPSQQPEADAEHSSDAPSPAPAPAEDAAPAAEQPEQANPAPAEQPAPKKVSVLNNSMTQGLADRVSRDLEGKGYELGEVGNFPEEVLPETTVFFPKGDAVAEAEARKIASGLGGIARENIDSLPDRATEGRGLTVVLTDA